MVGPIAPLAQYSFAESKYLLFPSWSYKWSLPKRFPHKILYGLFICIHATCPVNHNLIDFVILTVLSDVYKLKVQCYIVS